MSAHASHLRLIGWRPRLAALLAALTVSASIFGALVLSFQSASPDIWLAPTPQLLELASACDRQPARDLRERCRQQLVAAQLALLKTPVQLAKR